MDASEVDAVIESQTEIHGDIERVEKLEEVNDISGTVVWRMA